MKRILFLLIVIIFTTKACGQINFGKLGTDVLVDNSIKIGVTIIKSDYLLRNKKNGGLYGRGGKDFYGSVCYVGINMPTGILAFTDARTPWLTDSDFDKYRNNDSYEPVLKSIYVLTKNESDSVITKELSIDKEIVCNNDSTFFLFEDLNIDNKFDLQSDSYIKDSWIIWFSINKNQKLNGFDNLDFNTVYQKQEENINGKYIKTPFGTNTLLGGIVLTPQIVGVGKIALQLVGLLKKDTDNWKIIALPSEFIKKSKNIPLESAPKPTFDNSTGNDDELTPIKTKSTNKAKSKKNNRK